MQISPSKFDWKSFKCSTINFIQLSLKNSNLFNSGISYNSIKKKPSSMQTNEQKKCEQKFSDKKSINIFINFIYLFLCEKNIFLTEIFLMKLDRIPKLNKFENQMTQLNESKAREFE